MVSSPSDSPSRGSRRGITEATDVRLLWEIQSLSNALYHSERRDLKQGQPQLITSPKQLSPGEPIFSSSSFHKDVPIPGIVVGDSSSRHSMSMPQAPPFPHNPKLSHHSSSSAVPSQPAPAWGGDASEICPRRTRRNSIQCCDTDSEGRFTRWEDEWLQELSSFGSKLDMSSPSPKKKSVWNWKPLRALSHIGRQRVNCIFSIHVHAIEGLPMSMNGIRLYVHLRKEETKECAVQTMPNRVFQGAAEFQETMFMKCTLYCSKTNSKEFLSRIFILSVVAPDIEGLDFGKHQVDLSRLISVATDDQKAQSERGCSWDTALDLTGKAKGGKLLITFSYELTDKDSAMPGNASSRYRASFPHGASFHLSQSVPSSAHGTPVPVNPGAVSTHCPNTAGYSNTYNDMLKMAQFNLDELTLTECNDAALDKLTFTECNVSINEDKDFHGFQSSEPAEGAPSIASGNKLKSLFEKDPNFSGLSSQSVEGDKEDNSFNNYVLKNDEPELNSDDDVEFVVVEKGFEISHPVNLPDDGAAENDNYTAETTYDVHVVVLEEERADRFTNMQEHDTAETTYDDGNASSLMVNSEMPSETAIEVIDFPIDDNEIHGEPACECEANENEMIHEHVNEIISQIPLTTSGAKESVSETFASQATADSSAKSPNGELDVSNLEFPSNLSKTSKDTEEATGVEESASETTAGSLVESFNCELDESNVEITNNLSNALKDIAEIGESNENLESEFDKVAEEFLDMLNWEDVLNDTYEDEANSPRAQLLRQCEQELYLQDSLGVDSNRTDFLFNTQQLSTEITPSKMQPVQDGECVEGHSLNQETNV